MGEDLGSSSTKSGRDRTRGMLALGNCGELEGGTEEDRSNYSRETRMGEGKEHKNSLAGSRSSAILIFASLV